MHRDIEGELIDFSPNVRDALAADTPVVALESTIITHGMPYPQNVETARAVEAIVREEGAVPATIAVIGGRIRVGLAADELDRLGSATGVLKASRRDLAAAIVSQGDRRHDRRRDDGDRRAVPASRSSPPAGSAACIAARRQTFDISADLIELARTPVAVVCAGCKSILDIGKTLEFLETQGVPVIGYGTDEFPAFFARSSGHKLDHRFDTPRRARAKSSARIGGSGRGAGILIANPIPEEDALPADEIEARIAAAVPRGGARPASRRRT